MIRVRDLVVRFSDVLAVDVAELDIAPGERLGIEGPNGSGKSTFLRTLAGLQRPTSGEVIVSIRPDFNPSGIWPGWSSSVGIRSRVRERLRPTTAPSSGSSAPTAYFPPDLS